MLAVTGTLQSITIGGYFIFADAEGSLNVRAADKTVKPRIIKR